MVWDPQRTYAARFAYSPNRENGYGALMADAKFIRSTTPLGFDLPEIVKGFHTDGDKLWKGHEWPTERTQVRQDVHYTLNFELSAAVVGYALAFVMGLSTDQPQGGDVYRHLYHFKSSARELPSTEHWFRAAPDLGVKVHGAVCTRVVLGYTRGQPVCSLATDWVGSGELTWGDIAPIPDVDYSTFLNYLYEGDLGLIMLGAADITDRVQSLSIEFANGAKVDEGYCAGSGLYRKRVWWGARSVVPSLSILAKETDDLKTLFTDDTEKSLNVVWEGEAIGGGTKARLDITIPKMHFTAAKIGEANGEVAWQIAPGAEGIFASDATYYPPADPVYVINQDPTYLEL